MLFCHIAVLVYGVPIFICLFLPLLYSVLFYRYAKTSVLCRTGRDWIKTSMRVKNSLVILTRPPVWFSVQPYKQFYWHKIRRDNATESVTAGRRRPFVHWQSCQNLCFVKLLPLVIFSLDNWENWGCRPLKEKYKPKRLCVGLM